jgi:hypothetical protein
MNKESVSCRRVCFGSSWCEEIRRRLGLLNPPASLFWFCMFVLVHAGVCQRVSVRRLDLYCSLSVC